MLAFLILLVVAAGPLLRGSWDLWAQSLLFMAVTGGACAWLIARLVVGYLPLPSQRVLAWAAGLALWAGLSAAASPVAAYSLPAWRSLLLGLWIFPAMAAVSKDERATIDQAIRACGWVLVLLAFYQRWHEGIHRPPSALPNPSVFAGTVLLLLPLAVQKKDWLLAGGLVLALFWANSVAAWLGLSAALVLTRRQAGRLAYWAGGAIGLACLAAIYGKLQSPDVLNRWNWWVAACRMAWESPLAGFGPGSFGHVLPAYQDPGRSISTLYAHQHFLEAAAECGLPYAAAWGAGLLVLLRRGGAHKRFGAFAVLIASLWDYALSIPGNFWLFCYFTASSIPESSRGLNMPSRRKPLACAAVAVLALALGIWSWRRWQADRMTVEAVRLLQAGADPARALGWLDRASGLTAEPEAERLAAEIRLEQALTGRFPGTKAEGLRAAVERFERAARLNPYRASNWAALERLYLDLGQPQVAAQRRRFGARYCPVLRP